MKLIIPLSRSILLLLCLVIASGASAIGIVIPRTPDSAPPILSDIAIKADIRSSIATSRISQTFRNPNSRPVEADFYFPVPPGSDITDFILYMDGKPVRGEVLDKDEARQTYRDIVRRMKDPGLIEWSEQNLFRVRIFPIPANGDQKLEIELTQPLAADQGYYKFSLPIESKSHSAEKAAANVTLDLTIRDEHPVRNVFSPTHNIKTDELTSSTAVKVSLDKQELVDRENFVLFYETSSADVSLSLLAHRTGSEPGYFSLRISPPWDESSTSTQPGDYIFVIDSSGSMTADEKMEQAKRALQYCVNSLSPGDRFKLIRFSSSVDRFQTELQPAEKPNVKSATEWIDQLQARGGTNISGALTAAVDLVDNTQGTTEATARLTTVIFLTDGLPTVGETATDKIIKTIGDKSERIRIFTFGLGNDVNTRLLDAVAAKTGAASDYIAPETDLEVPISRFFDKASRPALVNPKLEIAGVQVKELFPPDLPDLFYGTDISVYGQYDNPASATITLTGTLAGEKQSFQFHKTFPAKEPANPFVEKLWATRKVAWLLDQVRDSGESSELKDEITALAKGYSIVTPYTSYLAMEDKDYAEPRRDLASPAKDSRSRFFAPAAATPSGGFALSRASALREESGAVAVQTARQLQTMKAADTVSPAATGPSTTRIINGRTFTQIDGVWVDSALNGEAETIKVKVFSEAWFHLVEKYPDLRQYFELGDKVRLQFNKNLTIETGEDGVDSIGVIQQRLNSPPEDTKN